LPFEDTGRSLRDILDAIAMIEQFVLGMNFDAFREDPRTIAAVERKLQIISEAAIRLGTAVEEGIPGPSWRNIRGLGNWLRHRYERIELPMIWKTLTDDLPPLKASVLQALSTDSTNPEGRARTE
jgi:uncharacterized protein with HEPN domain